MAKQLYLHGIESTGKRYIADDSGDHLIDFAPNVVTFPGRGSNVFNALTYGADPTGTVTSHDQISAAVTDAAAWAASAGDNARGAVLIPPGTYHGAALTLASHVDIFGYGATYTRSINEGGGIAHFDATSLTDFSIRGLRFSESLSGLNLRVFDLTSCTDFELVDVAVDKCGTWAMWLVNCSGFVIDRYRQRANDPTVTPGANVGIQMGGVQRFVISNSVIDADDDMVAITHQSGYGVTQESHTGVIANITGSSAGRFLLLARNDDAAPHIHGITVVGCVKDPSPIAGPEQPLFKWWDTSTSGGGIYDISAANCFHHANGLDTSGFDTNSLIYAEGVDRLTLRDCTVEGKADEHGAEFTNCDDLVVSGVRLIDGAVKSGFVVNGCARWAITDAYVNDADIEGVWVLGGSTGVLERFHGNDIAGGGVRCANSDNNTFRDVTFGAGGVNRSYIETGTSNNNVLDGWDHTNSTLAPTSVGAATIERNHRGGSTALLPAITGATASASQVANDTADLVIANGDATDSRT